MPKHHLSETYIHKGILYGPGEVDLPDDVAQDLEERGAFEKPEKSADDPKPAARR